MGQSIGHAASLTMRCTGTHLVRHASCKRKSRAGLRRAGELSRKDFPTAQELSVVSGLSIS